MKSQSGDTMSMGKGSIYSISRKLKLSTTSSTDSELVGAYNVMSQVMWTQYFLLAQNVKVSHNILLQDNKSAILPEKTELHLVQKVQDTSTLVSFSSRIELLQMRSK
jgi:hypothetical protein